MKISIIAAIDKYNGLGKSNKLLCYLPNDLKYFKKITMGKPILMGYNTFLSIGRALPGRRNIVLTSKEGPAVENVEFVKNKQCAIKLCEGEEEVMVIGGASLYQQFLDQCHRLYLTRIHSSFDADVFFPEIDWKQWEKKETFEGEVDAKNCHEHTFEVFDRY